eukprot:Skav226369  [mRNA]  locus=scaffold290:106051:108917:+ [translate_table: standard]
MKDKLDLRESEKPEKLSAFPLKFRAIRPCLLNVAERRTPGCRFSTWGMWNRRRCVVTLGSDDLRVYIADHKPPTVFDLKRLHVRRGQRHLELSRSNWMTKVFQRLCCCEPLSCTITLRLDQVEDLWAFLFPEQNIDTSSSRVPLAVFPPEVLHVITEFLILPTIHDVMRCSIKLREMLTADAFWQHFYIKLFPVQVRNQVEEFDDIDGCSVFDRVAIANLRFCNVCHARRHLPGSCACGAKQRFNKFVHFDMRAAEKLRLGLHRLSIHFMVKGFDLQAAFLSFSSRYHGNSLASMLRQTAAYGRMHLLVCESFTGEVFGALLRFPLMRRSSKRYGSSDRLMLFSMSPEDPMRVFEGSDKFPVVRSIPDALSIGTASQTALALNWDLSLATCEPSVLCHGSRLSGSSALRSVVAFSDASSDNTDRRISHLTSNWGTHPDVQRNVARQLLQLGGQQDLRHYFS